MKIVMISMVKNEADLIESFVRHSCTFADEMLVADHMSSDRTPEILEQLRQEGLPLTITHLQNVELAHAEVMTHLLWEAIDEHGADLILPVDADEFLVNTENSMSCREILEQLPGDAVYQLNWRRYEPAYPPHRDENRFLLSRPCRRMTAFDAGQKCIAGALAARRRPFRFIQGCHYAIYEDGSGAVPMTAVPYIHTAHFHWRSNEQFESKSVVSWINNISKYSLYTSVAGGLREFCKKILAHESPQSPRLPQESEDFDLTPFVPDHELRYSDGIRPDPMRNLLLASSLIAEAFMEEKYLRKENYVTVVLPFSGQADAWELSLQSLLEQTYPFLEVLVPVFSAEHLDRIRQFVAKVANEEAVHFILPQGGEDVFSIMERVARGGHVQWVLPGMSMDSRKIRLMSSCLDAQQQDGNYPLLACVGTQEFPDWTPYIDPVFEGDYMKAHPERIWIWMLKLGRYFSGGIGAFLTLRSSMSACKWFRGCFVDGLPQEFAMIRCLLLHGSIGEDPLIGILKEQLCSVRHEIPVAECALHQAEWHRLLQMDREMLSDEEYRNALQYMKTICEDLEKMDSQPQGVHPPLGLQAARPE